MDNKIPATGAFKSSFDIRTFTYPTKGYAKQKGGVRYEAIDIEDQSKVGICTAISLTQNARKATGIKYSADFQYLLQKTLYDGDWVEGSSIFSALKVAKNIGLLPESEWTYTTQADRDGSYYAYITKLKAVPQSEVARLMVLAGKHKIKAYASVRTDRDSLAEAIDNSKAGILTRYVIGSEWWTDVNGRVTWDKDAIQPLRAPSVIVSGHAVTDSNFNGSSFRIANQWGAEWADAGTAYRLQAQYAPTEAWAVFYQEEELPVEVDIRLGQRKEVIGQIMDLLQKVIVLLAKLA